MDNRNAQTNHGQQKRLLFASPLQKTMQKNDANRPHQQHQDKLIGDNLLRKEKQPIRAMKKLPQQVDNMEKHTK